MCKTYRQYAIKTGKLVTLKQKTVVDVQLWALVYHDCVMLYRQHASPYDYGMDNYGYVRGPWPAKFLRSLLYGDQSSGTASKRTACHLGGRCAS